MARITWEGAAEGVYHDGLDHGVLYPLNGPGVPWNGLIKVEERSTGGKNTPIYYEGKRYDIVSEPGEAGARISAFTYPDELDELVGFYRDEYGILYDEQESEYFSLSYRTRVTGGYRLNIYLNQIAQPTSLTRNSAGATPSPVEFSWDTIGTPMKMMGRTSSHLILDSRSVDEDLMKTLEDRLYGTNTRESSFVEFLEYLG